MENSGGSACRSLVPAWALPAAPARPQELLLLGHAQAGRRGSQSPHTESAAQAFIRHEGGLRMRREGWEALPRLAGDDQPPHLLRGCHHPENRCLGLPKRTKRAPLHPRGPA